jgi:formate hydrogenlyase subunit 3/multisubunit Na+/H+ antiporter MnhD subunit
VILIVAMVMALSQTGTSQMVPGSTFPSPAALLAFATLAFVGFGIDAAVVPFHIWLPDAHSECPTPVSALLSGIVVKTGIYGIVRLLFMVYSLPKGWSSIVVPLGLATAFIGGLLALFQMDGKRLIAMSSLSQVGLIIAGLGSGVFAGAVGATFHLINHSIIKSLLFLSAGWVMWRAGTRDLRAVGGRAMGTRRWIFPLFVVGVLSISGVPPFNGFYGKSIMSKSIAGAQPLLAGLSALVGMITLLSFMRLGWYLFIKGSTRDGIHERPPNTVVVTCASLAILCVVLGLASPSMVEVLDRGLEDGATTPIPSVFRPSLMTMIGYAGLAAALGIWLRKELVYRFFTTGPLGFVGRIAQRELYVDDFYLAVSRGVIAISAFARRSSSGEARDYMVYVVLAWIVGLLLVVGDVL